MSRKRTPVALCAARLCAAVGPGDDRVDGRPRVDPSDGVEIGVGATEAGDADGRSDMSSRTAAALTTADGVGCCTSVPGVVAAAKSGDGSGALRGTMLRGPALNVVWPPSRPERGPSSSEVRAVADGAPTCRDTTGRWELKPAPGCVPSGSDM